MCPLQCLRRSAQRSWGRGVAGDIFCSITEMARQTKQLSTNEDRPAGWHSRVLLPRLASIIGHNYLLRCCRVVACTCHAKFWGCSLADVFTSGRPHLKPKPPLEHSSQSLTRNTALWPQPPRLMGGSQSSEFSGEDTQLWSCPRIYPNFSVKVWKASPRSWLSPSGIEMSLSP